MGGNIGTTIGVIKGDTRSLDNDSYTELEAEGKQASTTPD